MYYILRLRCTRTALLYIPLVTETPTPSPVSLRLPSGILRTPPIGTR